jgi:type IV secretory pathway TrbD component
MCVNPRPRSDSTSCDNAAVHAAITAAAAFLVAVLWFDLMFDVQVWPHRGEELVPVAVIESIATYYRRVTTDASPMGKLISVVMTALVALLVWQAVRGGTAAWVSMVSLAATVTAVGLALTRVVPNAQRLGARRDPHAVQSALARRIFRDHLVFLGLMVTVLVVQLVAG